jgi:hypothetical protein
MTSMEHSPSSPLWRGSYLRCINASNGAELWKISLFGSGTESAGAGDASTGAIADGYIVALNYYDNQLYCFGKGPSALSLNLQNNVFSKGAEILITGKVTDESAGAKQKVANGEFSSIPTISDADQEGWMEYVYEQQSFPTDSKGVPVHLTAIDPNNNFQDIGYVTSDIYGKFAITWTPPVSGVYKVVATFEGSESYYGSSDEIAFGVSEPLAPSVTQAAQTPTSPSPSIAPQPTSAMPTTTYIAIAAAVVIIAVIAAALVLRRRK